MPFQPAKARQPLTEAQLYEYAVAALGRRMRTTTELSRLLRSRVEPGESGTARIERVLARLKEQNYLDDAAFAGYFTRLRQEGSKFGKRRVQQDLRRKGVHGELIATTLDAAYEHVNEEALAREYLDRKRTPKPSTDKETARVLRQLIRAGFSLTVAYRILKSWNVDEQTLAAIESIDLDHPDAEQ